MVCKIRSYPAAVSRELASGCSCLIHKSMETGDVEWNSPTVGITMTNSGDAVYEQFISEWR